MTVSATVTVAVGVRVLNVYMLAYTNVIPQAIDIVFMYFHLYKCIKGSHLDI